MTTVIVPPCQEPCCRVKRGKSARPETPEQVGKRIADAAVKAARAALAQEGETPTPFTRVNGQWFDANGRIVRLAQEGETP